MPDLLVPLQANQDARRAASLAAQEGRVGDALDHFREGAEAARQIVIGFARGEQNPKSFVKYWDYDGCPIILRWRDGQLVATTDDGPAVWQQWHQGPDDSDHTESVRYERYNKAGQRLGHGYLHPTTRKLVQSG